MTNEQLVVVDDYCIVAGTDTNYPGVNQFELEAADVPYFQEVSDARFMVVCFVEPIFSQAMLEEMMTLPSTSSKETSSQGGAEEADVAITKTVNPGSEEQSDDFSEEESNVDISGVGPVPGRGLIAMARVLAFLW